MASGAIYYSRPALGLGAPSVVYGILRPHIHALADLRALARTSRQDIFAITGRAHSQTGISDFKRDFRNKLPTYAVLITPARLQDQDRPELIRTCKSQFDSATLGDVFGAQWWVYGCGVTDIHFEYFPFARDIRVLQHGYKDTGRPCADDPVGTTRAAGDPDSICRMVSIRIDSNEVRVSSSPHCPMPETAVFRGTSVRWPL